MNYDYSYYSDDYNSADIIIKIPHFTGTGIKVAKMIERKRFNFSFNLVQVVQQKQKIPDQSKQCISSER